MDNFYFFVFVICGWHAPLGTSSSPCFLSSSSNLTTTMTSRLLTGTITETQHNWINGMGSSNIFKTVIFSARDSIPLRVLTYLSVREEIV